MGRAAHSIIAAALGVLLLPCAFAVADTPPPSSQPASQPATAPAGVRSTPVRALMQNAIAMGMGDAAEVRKAYYADTDEEELLVDAYAKMAAALATLRGAATEKFGPDGFSGLGFGNIFSGEVAKLSKAQATIDGDNATVRAGSLSFYLVKKDEEWKIDPSRTLKNVPRQTAWIDAQTGAYTELAEEIRAGKYKLVTDAQTARREKVIAATAKVSKKFPASQPATAP